MEATWVRRGVARRVALAHFLQQGQVKDSAGGTGDLTSELGAQPLPYFRVKLCQRAVLGGDLWVAARSVG